MTSRPWFKFYGRDYRDGVRDLPWEVTGIYSVLLTLLYEEGGRIKDHDQRLSRMIGCDVRLWKRARATMMEAGKLTLTEDGFLSNPRCAAEVRSAELVAQLSDKSAIATEQLTVSNTPKPQKTKDPPSEKAALAGAKSQKAESEETPSLRSGVSRRHRVAADLAMSDRSRAYAADHGFLNGRSDALWERFTAHHAAKGTMFADTEAGWRTWVLNEIKFQGERDGRTGAADALGQRTGAAVRSKSRSAASVILERAAQDELGELGSTASFDLTGS